MPVGTSRPVFGQLIMTMAMARPPFEDSQTNTHTGDKFRPEDFQRQFHGKMSVRGASTAKSASRERGGARPKTTRLRGGFGGNLRPNELAQAAFAADEYLKP
jgi:hypothetical protein